MTATSPPGPETHAPAARPIRRVCVLGNCGAGKSTLARQLGPLLGLPVIHLDQEYWRPGWREPDDMGEWKRHAISLAMHDEWVIDGGYSTTIDLRLGRADVAVWLDLPRSLCIGRVVRRVVRGYGRTRPDLSPGCPERFDPEFLHYAWATAPERREKLVEHLRERPATCTLIRLTRPVEVAAFLRYAQRRSHETRARRQAR